VRNLGWPCSLPCPSRSRPNPHSGPPDSRQTQHPVSPHQLADITVFRIGARWRRIHSCQGWQGRRRAASGRQRTAERSLTLGLHMSKHRVIAALLVGAVLGFLSTTAYAGPCTAQIARFEAAILQSSGNPMAGLTARQSVAAQLEHQPTPESLRQANERLKSQFDATMARAKRLDAQGNRSGCTRALNAAKRMYIL
jgi:hypothetical protein